MTVGTRPVVHVYCGLTTTAAEVLGIIPGADIHPPVRHGDLLRLDVGRGDTVVIIDGEFHHAAAVRHKEILELLAHGVHVVGASSMGALRAAELQRYGMTGVGSIFAAYLDGRIDADDEVAVAHAPDDCRPLTQALADIRAIVTLAVADGALDSSEADEIIGHAARLHYTERTWAALAHVPADPGRTAALQRLTTWLAARPRNGSAKHADAVASLRLVADGDLPASSSREWCTQPWRTYHLRHWIARYRGCTVDGVHVPFLAELQHQQLYDPCFPARWRRHVLTWIATDAASDGRAGRTDVEDRAQAAAKAKDAPVNNLMIRRRLACSFQGPGIAGFR